VLLERAAGSVSEGMLANTADVGGVAEYNTSDATMWFLHALARHIEVTGDLALARELLPVVGAIVDSHVAGTRYGIHVDGRDGLVAQGSDGLALTWMDARVDGVAITPRSGKPVEINALWISGLTRLARIADQLVDDPGSTGVAEQWRTSADRARTSFIDRFVLPDGSLRDVVDGPTGDDATLRPNQLIAAALPDGPLDVDIITAVVTATAPLLTPLGLRSLAPTDPRYRPTHRGDAAERDAAYHQGTVWPWLIGPYVEAAVRAGLSVEGVLDGLVAHVGEFGLGSVSETADAAAPHAATGCPFQAWSIAELIRARQVARQAARLASIPSDDAAGAGRGDGR
jgi:predicted glycogen debranching enzyme